MTHAIAKFGTHHWKAVVFVILGLCLAGVYSASSMPSSVFPQTNFPRVAVLIDNGEMPADEMMATVTKPVEQAMKDIPGVVNIRSNTGRGSSVVNVFFSWNVDMEQSELQVRSRLAQVQSQLPSTVEALAYRMTFSIFPVSGISINSPHRTLTELTQMAEAIVKPQFLRIPGVARVDLVGGHHAEFHIIADPLKLVSQGLSLTQVVDSLNKNNLVSAAGLHEEKDTLFLTLVDDRVRDISQIEDLVVGMNGDRPVRVRDFAQVKIASEPVNYIATADGVQSVLVMVRSQPYGSTLDIVDQMKVQMAAMKQLLPPDVKLAFFYDQSLLVRDSVRSVWEAIIFGLILSVVILFLFLKDAGTTLVAIVVIPVTVLVTILAMRLLGMSFNLMTLGGIASAIGLVIDNAIVVVEAIHTKMAQGHKPLNAVHTAIAEILMPLTGSTLTPVVVFIPLAFLDGVAGVFFRALALTMTVALLTSLVLAITLTPSLATMLIRVKKDANVHEMEEGGFILRRVLAVYDIAVRWSLGHRWLTVGFCALLMVAAVDLYGQLNSDLLPKLEERGFVADYIAPAGTSLTETNRALMQIENILKKTPEVESYSRRTGAALGLELVEPNTGDFLVKLRSDSKRSTEDVMADLRQQFKQTEPHIEWNLHGMLGDLIGDLVSSPEPIEIKLYSNDIQFLKETAPAVKEQIDGIAGVTDTDDGLVVAGPSLSFHVRPADAQRYGLSASDIAEEVESAKTGTVASSVLQGDQNFDIRVVGDPSKVSTAAALQDLPLRTPDGQMILLRQVADVVEEPGQLELNRDDLRQFVAVTGNLEKRDLGSAMAEIKAKLGKDSRFPPGLLEFGGLYQQQQETFHNLLLVMIMAVVLVFTVLLVEFRSYLAPLAIVIGALLALFGTIGALYITGISENIISRLGAITGVGIVAKNGILMLDFVDHLRARGLSLEEALIQSGRRRLRPVLMTSMAAALGMLPLAYGIGSGADMLRPLAVAVIGALCVSVLLSLVATPTVYYLMVRLFGVKYVAPESPPSETVSHASANH